MNPGITSQPEIRSGLIAVGIGEPASKPEKCHAMAHRTLRQSPKTVPKGGSASYRGGEIPFFQTNYFRSIIQLYLGYCVLFVI